MPDRFGDLGISTFSLTTLYQQSTDSNGLLRSSCEILDQELLQWDELANTIAESARPHLAPIEIVWMAYAEYGIEPPKFASQQAQRRMLFDLPSLLRRKGNPLAVRDAIILLTELSVDVVHLWNDARWFRAGITKSGIHRAGIPYRNARPNSGSHRSGFTAGYAKAGISPIGAAPVNEHLKMTIQLRLPRTPTSEESAAIGWAVRYFGRAVDIYRTFVPAGTKYWTVDYSVVNADTKVKPGFWKAGISKAGISTVCGTGIAPTLPSAPITPASPGTWIPWYNGGLVYFLPIP